MLSANPVTVRRVNGGQLTTLRSSEQRLPAIPTSPALRERSPRVARRVRVPGRDDCRSKRQGQPKIQQDCLLEPPTHSDIARNRRAELQRWGQKMLKIDADGMLAGLQAVGGPHKSLHAAELSEVAQRH